MRLRPRGAGVVRAKAATALAEPGGFRVDDFEVLLLRQLEIAARADLPQLSFADVFVARPIMRQA